MHWPFFNTLHLTAVQGQCFCQVSIPNNFFISHSRLAHIPLFLYPFLNTVTKSRPFESLRLTSLGVIGALVKMDDSQVINFLLSTEIIPLCKSPLFSFFSHYWKGLRIMETGSELSKTVATFIVQKILYDDTGYELLEFLEIDFL